MSKSTWFKFRMCRSIFYCSLLLFVGACQSNLYPRHWFKPIKTEQAASWEILPQAAATGEVILSKRNELGILSNYAATPVFFMGKHYASVEGLWQSMKYPENNKDLRARFPGVKWAYSRSQVEQMTGMKARGAGELANKNMEKMGVNWVTFNGKRMTYRTQEMGEHYQLIRKVLREKLKQNPEVKAVLARTGELRLRPDHKVPEPIPPAWKYYDIWMELRSEL